MHNRLRRGRRRGDESQPRQRALRPVPRGTDRRLAHLQHGPHHHSRQRSHLCHHRRRGAGLPAGQPTQAAGKFPEVAHAAGAGQAADRRAAGQLLLEPGGTDPESRGHGGTAARYPGVAQRLQRAEGVGPVVGLQHEEHTEAEDIPGGEAGLGDEGLVSGGGPDVGHGAGIAERPGQSLEGTLLHGGAARVQPRGPWFSCRYVLLHFIW